MGDVMEKGKEDSAYSALGVSAQKGDVHAAVANLDQGLFPGAFCKLLPDYLTGSPDHCMLMHADGAGTKTSAAYVAWREHHKLSEQIWAWNAQDALIMNIDDAACVGALGSFLVSNNLGRNTHRVPGEVVRAVILGYESVCQMLRANGIQCHLSGGETADVPDLVRTLMLDCTIVGRLRRDEVIDCSRMQPGDLIVGFSSTGQAKWETTPNSGIGSNGLTLARHVLMTDTYRKRYPESFAPELKGKAYRGKLSLVSDRLTDSMTIGEALLSPTRTYAPLVKFLLERLPRDLIHGLIHCSGGGQTKIRKFGGLGLHFVKDNPFSIPPFFRLIQKEGQISWREMYEVFNMGWRFEVVVCDMTVAEACIATARECGIEAQIVGRVKPSVKPGESTLMIMNPEDGRPMFYPEA